MRQKFQMVSVEIKASLGAHSLPKILYHVTLIIFIEFIYLGTCLPRVMDKNYEEIREKTPIDVSDNIPQKDNRIIDSPAWSLKTKHLSDNMLEVEDERLKKGYNLGFKLPQRHFAAHLENEKSQGAKSNWKASFEDDDVNAHGRSNTHDKKEPIVIERQHHHGRIVNSFDDSWNLSHEEKQRVDEHPHDKVGSAQYNLSNEKIMDYFFNNDARDSESRRRLRNQGVIINLRGLIPYEDTLPERLPSSATDRKVKSGNGDELLAFKAFEIDSSPQPDSTTFTDDYEEGANHVIDISKVTSRVDFIDEGGLEARNLSRKRRQRASPNAEEVEDEEQSRRRYFRRRRRKRKRRHRHSKNLDEPVEEGDIARQPFLLKSHGPAYVITSAKELKKDWCRTVPLKQRIEEKNCKSKIISNNFCYGQCNSFFIPHQGRTGNGAAFQSCAFCKPNKHRWINVTLQCPGEEPNRVEKKILLVESCRCMTEILQ